MTKKTKCLLGIAGSMLAASSLYAGYSESFETTNVSAKPEAWSDGWVTNLNYSYSGIAGRPVAETSARYFVIEGDATCTPGGTFTGAPLVDMMVQVALPDDVLETPEDAHIAVAVDTTGKFNVYCKDKSGTDSAAWNQLSDTQYTAGTWVRVSLLFDYDKGRCQVRLDGQPMMTEKGYLDAATTDTTKKGAWYNLASTGSAVSNLKVVGCTAVDDVVIAENSTSYTIAGSAVTNGVSCAWLDRYGLAWDTTKSYDSSVKSDGTTPMTVADKYKYCFDPFNGQGEADFAVKSISTTTAQVTLALPNTVDTAGRKVVVDYGTDKDFGTYDTTDEVTGQQSVQINVPAPGSVNYYRIRATNK